MEGARYPAATFPKRLKALRTNTGISQKELAESFDVSPFTIACYETGVRRPNIDFLIVIASYFSVTTDYLLGVSNMPAQDTEYYEKVARENTALRERLSQIEQLCRLADK